MGLGTQTGLLPFALHHPHPNEPHPLPPPRTRTHAPQTCYQVSPYVFHSCVRAELRVKYGLTLQQSLNVRAAVHAGVPGDDAVAAVKAQAAADAEGLTRRPAPTKAGETRGA